MDGKNRGFILMAGRAQGAAGIVELGRGAGAIVAHDLEFEAPGRFVVADHFEHASAFVVAEKAVDRAAAQSLRAGRHRQPQTTLGEK